MASIRCVAGSVREVERLEDALSRAEAGRLSAEASLAHSSAMQQGDLRTAQQALQAANRDLKDCQARLADLETTNALLIQEQQVLNSATKHTDLHSASPMHCHAL